MKPLTCSGPGPHRPESGVLGEVPDTYTAPARCSSPACELPPTAEHLAARDNDTRLRERARTALDANRTYLAVAAPTAAQNVAQVRALTQQINGLIRLTLHALDGTD